ncbi:hypothetical protein MTYP_02912 [Methylophilaceae bacterium]|nr:hypothetical protein MTYP_02912 [Methylophilaceae bacterium]
MKTAQTLLVAAACLLSTTANATLYSRLNGQAVYDSDLNITWLADANYAKTSGYNADGFMNWGDAKAWADGLSFGGYTDWRLPNANPICGPNYFCTSSEMGHLFYTDLGGIAGQSINATHNSNYSLFQNVPFGGYWSGTDSGIAGLTPNYADAAWLFYFTSIYSGTQDFGDKNSGAYALAVRPGDSAPIAAAPAAVPEPATYTILLAGLGLLGLTTRHKKTSLLNRSVSS